MYTKWEHHYYVTSQIQMLSKRANATRHAQKTNDNIAGKCKREGERGREKEVERQGGGGGQEEGRGRARERGRAGEKESLRSGAGSEGDEKK